ncbi:hypothetical protein HMPREF1092_03042 [Clostridium thermobutyricum]|uniref:Uncharacterized protein n=1 Tax=Clostridium thermobutyricum TaxID=29372 RepID=N9WA50_9CLOT|nr:hypothetical protein [Clostridium thermobutyricum]ENY99905.1 hypothetical protein HMPREF1092_03042 [Clostridium thermobutyricum]
MKKGILWSIIALVIIVISMSIYKLRPILNTIEVNEKGKLVCEYEINDIESFLDNIYFENGDIIGEAYLFDLNKNMEIREDKVYLENDELTRAIKIGDKVYGDLRLLTSGVGYYLNYISKSIESYYGDKRENIDIKKVKFKINKNCKLDFLEEKKIDTNKYIDKLKLETSKEIKENPSLLNYVEKEDREYLKDTLIEELESLKNELGLSYLNIKDVYYSDYRYYVVRFSNGQDLVEGIVDNKEEKIYLGNKNEFSIYDSKIITDVIYLKGKFIGILENGSIIELGIENNKLKVNKTYRYGNIIDKFKGYFVRNKGKLLGIKGEDIYILLDEELIVFNLNNKKFDNIWRKDNHKIIHNYNFNDGFILFTSEYKLKDENVTIIDGHIENKKVSEDIAKMSIGKLEGNKIKIIVDNIETYAPEITRIKYYNEYAIVIKNDFKEGRGLIRKAAVYKIK